MTGNIKVNPKIEPTKRYRPWDVFIWISMARTPYGYQPIYNLCAMRQGSWTSFRFDQSTLGM